MSAQADARGLKRVCTECGVRFYDMNKRPINCPGCEAEFTGVEKIKARRGRAKAEEEAKVVEEKTAPPVANDDDEEEDSGVKEMSLDDLEITEKTGDSDGDDEAAVIPDLDDDNLDDLNVDLEEGPDLDSDAEEKPEKE